SVIVGSLFQALSERLLRALETRLDRLLAFPRPLGHRADGEPLVVALDQHPGVRLADRLERLADPPSHLLALGHVGGHGLALERPDRPERPLRLALGAPRAMAEADAVLRDREHPRLDRRVATEAVAAAPGFEQRLLHE